MSLTSAQVQQVINGVLTTHGLNPSILQSNFPQAANIIVVSDASGDLVNSSYFQQAQTAWYVAHPQSTAPSAHLLDNPTGGFIIAPDNQPSTINGLPNVAAQQLTLVDSQGN